MTLTTDLLEQGVEEQLRDGYRAFMYRFDEKPGAIIMSPDMIRLIVHEIKSMLMTDVTVDRGPRYRDIPIIIRPEMPMTGVIMARKSDFPSQATIEMYCKSKPQELSNDANQYIAKIIMSNLLEGSTPPKPSFKGLG